MSPLSIPGTSIQIPYPPKYATCKNCGKEYNTPRLKRDGNLVILFCPYCKYKVKTFSYEELEGKHLIKIQLESITTTISTLDLDRKKIKVFISYAKEDFPKAEEIYTNFKARGYTVWMDKQSLLPGQEWEFEIKKAIQDSDFFVACISHCSISKRGFVQKEIRYALDILTTVPYGQIYFIPVRLEQCDVPRNLSHLQWIDLDTQGAYAKLFQAFEQN